MGVKISELTSATSLTGSEEFPIVQAGNTKKTTIQQIKNDNYSTTEQVVGTWINGKPLYEQTITGTAPNVTSDGTAVNLTLSTLNGIDVAMIDRSWAETNVNNWSLPYINNSGRQLKTLVTHYTSSGTRTGKVDIVVTSSGTAYNGASLVVSVRYTKTTDTATRGGEQLRSTNTGSLVGSGEKSNLLLEEIESKEKQVEETPVEEKTEIEESGETLK